MTRARDHLVLSAYRYRRSSWLENIDGIALEDAFRVAENPVVTFTVDSPFDFRETDALLERWGRVSQRDPRTTPTARARASHPIEDDADEEPPIVLEDERPIRRVAAKSGTAFGRAVHLVLQNVDLGAPDVSDNARSAAELFGCDPDDVARYARNALASSPVREASLATRTWREVYAAKIQGEPEAEPSLIEALAEGNPWRQVNACGALICNKY